MIMKHLNYFFSALCAILLLTSCDNGDNNLPKRPDESRCYIGEMIVDQNDGTFYTQSDVEVDFETTSVNKLNFKMYKVKFASAMPLTLNMAVEGVDYISDGENYVLSGNNIVPYALGGPFEKYTITNLSGAITDTEMTLIFMCGEYPVTYVGSR